MTGPRESPWAEHMPDVQGEHTMPSEEFDSIIAALTEVLSDRVCCCQHGARVAVTVAIACLMAERNGNVDTTERDLTNVCSTLMEGLRTGVIRLAEVS